MSEEQKVTEVEERSSQTRRSSVLFVPVID